MCNDSTLLIIVEKTIATTQQMTLTLRFRVDELVKSPIPPPLNPLLSET